jgi:sugar lactone lactonase YvrE
MSELENLVNAQQGAGETPIWVPEENALYWIDVIGGTVHRYNPADGQVNDWKPDVAITALARRASGAWIIATTTGMYFWDHETNQSEFIADPEADNPDCRCNDGVVDRQGRFLVGTMNEKELTAPDGCLFRMDPDGTIHKLDDGFALTNGIALSPDGTTLYVTDMMGGSIRAYDYDTGTGEVSNKRIFVEVPSEAGVPDGLIVDSEGFIWSAHWGGSRVTRYDPDGAIEREIPVPAANVTCMGFGGADLDELYITTAWFLLSDDERKDQPQAGDLFRIKTDVKGLPEPGFAG